MASNFRKLTLEDRIRLVEDLWDSIAEDQAALKLTPEQAAELDARLDAIEVDGLHGDTASLAISRIRRSL